MEEQFLQNVYGYQEIKRELKVIQNWYFNSESLGDRRKLLPKGLLFYSGPGQGKTHIVREYSKSFGYPVFIIEGNDDNVLDEIVKAYKKATKEKNAIVVIDEIDKLISKDTKLTRILMAQLDGFRESNVLTLATCNNYDDMPNALLREGRFDRHFQTCINTDSDLTEMIKGFSKDAGLKLTDYDITELVEVFYHCAPSFIRSVFSNSYLRYGCDCSIGDIINTADFLRTGFINKTNDFEVSKSTAVHEAGHAVYLYLFCKTQKFLRVYFDENGGKTVYRDMHQYESRESRIETIRAGLAGLVAEDLLLKNHGIGCGDDLEKVYNLSFRLVNRTCINGIKNFCTLDGYYDKKTNSEYLNKIFDHKASSFMRKNYRLVKKELHNHKDKILKIAEVLMMNKEIKRDQFEKIMNGEEDKKEISIWFKNNITKELQFLFLDSKEMGIIKCKVGSDGRKFLKKGLRMKKNYTEEKIQNKYHELFSFLVDKETTKKDEGECSFNLKMCLTNGNKDMWFSFDETNMDEIVKKLSSLFWCEFNDAYYLDYLKPRAQIAALA